MRISFDMPDAPLSVVDATTYKGHQVTVLRMFGEDVLYYHGRKQRESTYPMDNGDWEDVFRYAMVDAMRKIFLADPRIAADWQEENPTGRDVYSDDLDIISFVREES